MSTQGNNLTAIADAIREKDGTTAPIEANDFPDRIRAIETGVDTSDATAAADDILLGKTAYVNGEKVTGEIPNGQLKEPFLNISSNGLILAQQNVIPGYISETAVASAPSTDMQLSTQSSKVWTPTTQNQTIASQTFLTGTQTIKGDSNLVASNIKQGVTIFGIMGSLSSAPTYVSVNSVYWDNDNYAATVGFASNMRNISGLFCYFQAANTELRVTIMYLPQKNFAVGYRGNANSNITIQNYGQYARVIFVDNKFSVLKNGTCDTYEGIVW